MIEINACDVMFNEQLFSVKYLKDLLAMRARCIGKLLLDSPEGYYAGTGEYLGHTHKDGAVHYNPVEQFLVLTEDSASLPFESSRIIVLNLDTISKFWLLKIKNEVYISKPEFVRVYIYKGDNPVIVALNSKRKVVCGVGDALGVPPLTENFFYIPKHALDKNFI